MVDRLGAVIYWLGVGLAVLSVGAGAYIFAQGAVDLGGSSPVVWLTICGVFWWGIGWIIRFILTGKKSLL